MKERNLKKHVKSFMYGSAALTLVLSIFFIGQINNNKEKEKEKEPNYVTNTVIEDVVPVITEENEKIGKPYGDHTVKMVRSYYDYKGEANNQVSSIVYYENTYIQNSGVDYSGTATFDVVSIADGTVTKVTDDKLMGKIIEIRHNNDLISIYQSLSEVVVKKDDSIKKGQIIGKSGTSTISSELKDHLHLEVSYKGEMINPETIYEKTFDELEG